MKATRLRWWEGGPLRPGQKVIQAVVFRQSGEKTVAIVRALVPTTFGDDDDNQKGPVMTLYEHINMAVSDWLRTATAGRRYVESTMFDFNVGDLVELLDPGMNGSAYYDPQELETFLQQHDIIALHIETYMSDELWHTWDYDDPVFDNFEITAEYYEEGDRRDEKRCSD